MAAPRRIAIRITAMAKESNIEFAIPVGGVGPGLYTGIDVADCGQEIPFPFSRADGPPPRSHDDSEDRGDEDCEERVGDEALPSDVQDLIDPHPGDGPGEHHEERRQEVDAEEEPNLLGDDRDRD